VNGGDVAIPPHWAFPLMWLVAGWPYLVAAFLLGSIPFGLVVGRVFFKSDLRAAGSGNIGAANALRTLGTKAGAAVLVLDACKGVAAVALAWAQGLHVPLHLSGFGTDATLDASVGPIWPLIPLAGLAAVLGHCYTPWLRFRGGKGVATFLGATAALSWESGVAFALVWLAVVVPTGFSSLGSLLATAAAGTFVVVGGARYGDSAAVFAFGAALVIVWKHRENIARLRAGTEHRLSLLKR
jgi:glycerol-3-phosphate acyltransferase PlsY